MPKRDRDDFFTATTADAEIREGTELKREEGFPATWHPEDGVFVTLPDDRKLLFAAEFDRGKDLFSWGFVDMVSGATHLARLHQVDGQTMRVELVEGVP